MKIKTIRVLNLGPLRDITLSCDPLTLLVGKNGVGKSTLLRALNLFYNTNIQVDERDFYNGETDSDISITLKFTDLPENEMDLYKPYIKGEELSVEKIISYQNGKLLQKYHGTKFINQEFSAFRSAGGSDMRTEYNKIKDKYGFPNYTNAGNAEETMGSWEVENKDECIEARDEGQFFGYKNVGVHKLDRYTKFIFIPAVHEAEVEGTEGRGSTISEIMDILVRGILSTDPELLQIEQDAQTKYEAFIAKAKTKQLLGISKDLTKSLNAYFPDTTVDIDWVDDRGISLQPPKAYIKVTEEGYQNTIDKCGHGLQRAFILTMFQALAIIQSAQLIEEGTPDEARKTLGLIIGIEEPELYQHPDRQRHLANTLLQLTSRGIEGVGDIQVIYSTHSPLMVDYERFDQIRIFHKIKTDADKPKHTKVDFTTLRNAATFVEQAKGYPLGSITDESYRQRLISLMTPWMNEGFFAKLVVLVEGIKDLALVVGHALKNDIHFDRNGISVIPCSGKDSLTEAISIFKCLNIPCYTVWDSDHNPVSGETSGVNANHNILRCYGCATEDAPDMITENFTCIHTDLEKKVREDIGIANFDRALQKYCDDNFLGKGKYVMENPLHVSKILSLLEKEGFVSETLECLEKKIMEKFKNVP